MSLFHSSFCPLEVPKTKTSKHYIYKHKMLRTAQNPSTANTLVLVGGQLDRETASKPRLFTTLAFTHGNNHQHSSFPAAATHSSHQPVCWWGAGQHDGRGGGGGPPGPAGRAVVPRPGPPRGDRPRAHRRRHRGRLQLRVPELGQVRHTVTD